MGQPEVEGAQQVKRDQCRESLSYEDVLQGEVSRTGLIPGTRGTARGLLGDRAGSLEGGQGSAFLSSVSGCSAGREVVNILSL